MLFGRTSELHRVSVLAEKVRQGAAKAVFLSGRPGIGKTAFLEAVAHTHTRSFQRLRVTGHLDESTLPFAAVERLVAPLCDSVEQLPGPQRTALRVVFGIEEGAVDPLLVHLAVTGALHVAARNAPLMVLVDDFHLLDEESAGVISFLSRRIDGAPICLVCAKTWLSTMNRSVGSTAAWGYCFGSCGMRGMRKILLSST